jgi:integrase
MTASTATKPRKNPLHSATFARSWSWLAEEYDHPDPWADKALQRYAAPEPGRRKTLSEEFIADLLTVTGGGSPRVRDFARLRDHAIIRTLTDGVRAEELGNMRIQDVDLENALLAGAQVCIGSDVLREGWRNQC